jgi:hypothetical protein
LAASLPAVAPGARRVTAAGCPRSLTAMVAKYWHNGQIRGRLSGLGTDRRQNNRFGAGITVSQVGQDSAPDRRLRALPATTIAITQS